MCRFLLVQSKNSVSPQKFLKKFSLLAKNSKALDGDWQGDGWGIAWVEDGYWEQKKSLHPIWKDNELFNMFPKTNIFLVHARSASFPQHKGVVAFNQPYISSTYAFVFNGLLKGVSLSNVEGKIGAQKIWNLLQKELVLNSPEKALANVKNLLIQNSKEIIALNLGLATKKNVFSLNYFTLHPEYYSLHTYKTEKFTVVCSEKLPNLDQLFVS